LCATCGHAQLSESRAEEVATLDFDAFGFPASRGPEGGGALLTVAAKLFADLGVILLVCIDLLGECTPGSHLSWQAKQGSFAIANLLVYYVFEEWF
jgi:hypothetical protein